MAVTTRLRDGGKSDDLCVQCARGKVDRPRSASLCLWCRLGTTTADDDARRRLEYRADPVVVSYVEGRGTVEAIAAAHGVSPSTVSRRLRLAGVPVRPRGTPVGAHRIAIDDAELVRAYVVEGLSLEQLADRFACHWQTAKRRLVVAGVQIRPRGCPPKAAVA